MGSLDASKAPGQGRPEHNDHVHRSAGRRALQVLADRLGGLLGLTLLNAALAAVVVWLWLAVGR